MTGLFNLKEKDLKTNAFKQWSLIFGSYCFVISEEYLQIALRWSSTSKESYYFFFSLLIARDRCFLWLRDKYIYCLTCSYPAWPLTKYKRGIILSCQMPSKNDRARILPHHSHSFEEDVNLVVISDSVLPALLDTFLSHWRKRKWSFHHELFVNFNYLSAGE